MNGLTEGTARAQIYSYLEGKEYRADEEYADPSTTARAIAHNLKMNHKTVKGALVGLVRIGMLTSRYARIPLAPKRVVVYGVTGKGAPLALSQDDMARVRQHLKEIDRILGAGLSGRART